MSIDQLLRAEKITTVITDLDQTLWAGTVAEQEDPRLNSAYYNLLQELHRKGIQIIVVSKNDESVVNSAFQRLDIDRKLFTYVVANWEPKYESIQRLLDATRIRPETVVFVDDSELERIEVAARFPDMHCIEAKDWYSLNRVPFLTEKQEQSQSEISTRVNRYRTAIESYTGEQPTTDIDFLISLRRAFEIHTVNPDYANMRQPSRVIDRENRIVHSELLNRSAALLARTHRLNFNPGKFSDDESAREYLIQRYSVGDQLFAVCTYQAGKYLGITGALVIHKDDSIATITDAAFSCGTIGRGFEQKTILELMQRYKKIGLREIQAYTTMTEINQDAQGILEELGFKKETAYTQSLETYSPTDAYHWIEVHKKLRILNPRQLRRVAFAACPPAAYAGPQAFARFAAKTRFF